MNFHPTIAIATYNRSRLLRRAIESAIHQNWPDLEVLVIDDGSTDDTPWMCQSLYPQARYLRQDRNRGVGAARNRALREASQPWVVFLDDDDTLLRGALACIALRIAEFSESERYPVLQFSRSNGRMPGEFMIGKLEHYASEELQGDFVPVIQRERFLTNGLAYPEIRSAGEGLLWWHVAHAYGIPTWKDRVAQLHTDAPVRITSIEYQLSHARDFAELQERILREFGEILASRFPTYYRKKLMGAATYRLLSGDRDIARAHLRLLARGGFSLEALGLWAFSFAPRAWTEKCFASYRRRTSSPMA